MAKPQVTNTLINILSFLISLIVGFIIVIFVSKFIPNIF